MTYDPVLKSFISSRVKSNFSELLSAEFTVHASSPYTRAGIHLLCNTAYSYVKLLTLPYTSLKDRYKDILALQKEHLNCLAASNVTPI